MPVIVTGTIELPQGSDSFSGATIYISVESTGMMDMPSTVMAQSTLNNVSYNGSAIPFEVNGTLDDDAGHLSLRVHISMPGTDDVQKGDYITKRQHNLSGSSNRMNVRVERV